MLSQSLNLLNYPRLSVQAWAWGLLAGSVWLPESPKGVGLLHVLLGTQDFLKRLNSGDFVGFSPILCLLALNCCLECWLFWY